MTRTKYVHSFMFDEQQTACAYDHDVERMSDEQLHVGLMYLIDYKYPKPPAEASRNAMQSYHLMKRICMRPHYERLELLWHHFRVKRNLKFEDFNDE